MWCPAWRRPGWCPQAYIEHLKEFQVRLFRSVLGLLAGCIVAYFFYDQIFAIVRRPSRTPLATTLRSWRRLRWI